MKILFFQWNAFMQKEIEEQLKISDIEYEVFYHILSDWEKDDRFCEQLEDKLKVGGAVSFDAVFSVNFVPLIAKVANKLGVRYISWVYDCPLHIRDEEPLALDTNTVYFFDRSQAEYYSARFNTNDTFYHLPLAAKPQLIEVGGSYDCDVSLLGKLYQSDFAYLCGPLDNYYRGYLDGIVSTQIKLGSGYIIDEMLSDELMNTLNDFYKKASLKSSGKVFSVDKREMEFTLATEATGRQRFMALALLESRLKTALYSGDKDERLVKTELRGYVDYYSKMPDAFAKSKLNLNISLSAIKTGIPLRVLDICKTGATVLSNAQPELFEYFVPGESIIVYEDMKDLVEKALFYAAHDEERIRIAKKGYDIVCQAFSFKDRVDVLFS